MPAIDEILKAVAPNASPAFIKASLNAGAIMRDYGITSLNAQCQLIGHMAVECAGFKTFEENLNYSAQRLTQVWPNRFPSIAAAAPYAKNPHALANKVYNGRMGNKPGSDDGWNYRGSGGLQHTGASEFQRVKKRTSMDVVAHPEWLRTITNANAMWMAACSYFVDRGALAAANAGDTTAVCIKVNGGTNGLADRKMMVARAMAAFHGETIQVTEMTSHEQADDAKRKAKQATGAAPAAGAGSGVATDQASKPAQQPKGSTSVPTPDAPAPVAANHTAAIVVGIAVMLVIGVVAFVFWRKHFAKQAEIETTALKSIDARIDAAIAQPTT